MHVVIVVLYLTVVKKKKMHYLAFILVKNSV